jgi:hypothetical protein
LSAQAPRGFQVTFKEELRVHCAQYGQRGGASPANAISEGVTRGTSRSTFDFRVSAKNDSADAMLVTLQGRQLGFRGERLLNLGLNRERQW